MFWFKDLKTCRALSWEIRSKFALRCVLFLLEISEDSGWSAETTEACWSICYLDHNSASRAELLKVCGGWLCAFHKIFQKRSFRSFSGKQTQIHLLKLSAIELTHYAKLAFCQIRWLFSVPGLAVETVQCISRLIGKCWITGGSPSV